MKLRVPRTTTYDLPLVLVVVALTLLGLAMVYSASGIRALDALEDRRYFLAQQSAWASLGVAGMIVASRVGYHRYRALAVPLLALAILLLVLVLVPGIGVRAGGAARWLRLGELIGVQPAEVAKLALILYLGTWLGARREALRSWPITAWFLAVTAVIAGLVFVEPDLVTAIVVVPVALGIYFVAGARLREFGALAAEALSRHALATPLRAHGPPRPPPRHYQAAQPRRPRLPNLHALYRLR